MMFNKELFPFRPFPDGFLTVRKFHVYKATGLQVIPCSGEHLHGVLNVLEHFVERHQVEPPIQLNGQEITTHTCDTYDFLGMTHCPWIWIERGAVPTRSFHPIGEHAQARANVQQARASTCDIKVHVTACELLNALYPPFVVRFRRIERNYTIESNSDPPIAIRRIHVLAVIKLTVVHIVDRDEVAASLTAKDLSMIPTGSAEIEPYLTLGWRIVYEDLKEISGSADAIWKDISMDHGSASFVSRFSRISLLSNQVITLSFSDSR